MTYRTLLLTCLFSATPLAFAQQEENAASPKQPTPVSVLAGRTDTATTAPASTPLLSSHPYTSDFDGVSFQPPAGWKQSERPNGDEIVNFSNKKNWTLRVTRANLDHAIPLVNTPKRGTVPEKTGMLDLFINGLKESAPDTQILRNEVVNVDANVVGIVIARYTLNGQPWLRQQAMMQAMQSSERQGPLGEESGKLYYVFNLITPAGTAEDDELAASTFSAMVDTVKLLDRTKIRQDQADRLYRTRSLFTYWKRGRFEKIVVPRQFFRVLKNGKDVGYTFYEELLDNPNLAGVSAPGPIAYERTHLEEADDKGHERHTDAGLFKYMSFDMSRERWTRSVVLQAKTDAGNPFETYGTEFGESQKIMKRVFTKREEGGVVDPGDPKSPPAKMVEIHTLDITIAGKNQNGEPLHRELPPFYIPQAAWHFLPRLVVDHKAFPESRTYMFAVYNSDKKEVMSLYVDKSAEQEINFGGRKFDGVTVTERLGLGGAPVIHYLTVNGVYVGSEDKDQHLTTLATDEQDLIRRWPKANLTRPEPMQAPAANAGGSPVLGEPSSVNPLPPALR